jgi:hypothetical protein
VTATESQITISGSWKLRGRSCGLCGDFNQELDSEFKTASRCAVFSGTSMASSFQVSTVGHQCAIPRQLKSEIEACRSVDKFVVTKFDVKT